MDKYNQMKKIPTLLCLIIMLSANFTLTTFSVFASPQNATSAGFQEIGTSRENAINIVLVHGAWGDGSGWSKVIPILKNAGHEVIAAQLPLHTLEDDIAIVKRAIEHIGGPTVLVGYSYGGSVITNAGHNNPNVTRLVQVSALAPDEAETANDLFAKFPKEFLEAFYAENKTVLDSAGFSYFIPEKLHESVAQDLSPAEAQVMAIVQKPINQSILAEKSWPPAWKQLPTWFQISEDDRSVSPDTQHFFAERMNATTLVLNSSHSSIRSHPNEIATFILNATKETPQVLV